VRLKPLNLIFRGSPKRRSKHFFKFVILGLLLIFIFIGIPAITVTSYRLKTTWTKRAIEDTKNRFKKTQSQNFQSEKLKADLTKEETQVKQLWDLLSSTESRGFGYSGLLLSIAGLLPQDVWITHLVMNDNEIQISGSTVSSQFIADLMTKLEECKDLKNSRFVSTEKQIFDSHTIYNFQIAAEPIWSENKTLSGAPKSKAKKE